MSESEKKTSAAEITRGNDRLRKTGAGGRVVTTSALLASPLYERVIEACRAFGDFTSDNDPYDEHDCAVIRVGGEEFMFKIDYYEDEKMDYGADPYDGAEVYRVMTIMHARDR